MKKFLMGIWTFIGKNASILIALSSMLIALSSLLLTVRSQQIEREYKELAIQPHVSIGANVSEFAYELSNEGYGHAFITRFVFGLDGKCYSSDKTPSNQFGAALDEFYNLTAAELFLKTAPPQINIKDINVTMTPLMVGATIRAGEKFSIFRLEQDTQRNILKSSGQVFTAYRNAFAKAGSKLPLAIEYCSATGLYCELVRTENETCQ